MARGSISGSGKNAKPERPDAKRFPHSKGGLAPSTGTLCTQIVQLSARTTGTVQLVFEGFLVSATVSSNPAICHSERRTSSFRPLARPRRDHVFLGNPGILPFQPGRRRGAVLSAAEGCGPSSQAPICHSERREEPHPSARAWETAPEPRWQQEIQGFFPTSQTAVSGQSHPLQRDEVPRRKLRRDDKK